MVNNLDSTQREAMDIHVETTVGLEYTNKVKKRKRAVKPDPAQTEDEEIDPATGKKKE